MEQNWYFAMVAADSVSLCVCVCRAPIKQYFSSVLNRGDWQLIQLMWERDREDEEYEEAE